MAMIGECVRCGKQTRVSDNIGPLKCVDCLGKKHSRIHWSVVIATIFVAAFLVSITINNISGLTENILAGMEWSATVLSLIGAVLVAMSSRSRRQLGFFIWIVSNLIWMVWAFSEAKWGVFTLFTAYQFTSALGWWNSRKV